MPLAVGVLGIRPADLGKMKISDVRRAIIARHYYDQQQQRIVAEAIRLSNHYNVGLHTGDDKLSPKSFWRYPWEDEGGSKPMTHADRVKAHFEKLKQENQ